MRFAFVLCLLLYVDVNINDVTCQSDEDLQTSNVDSGVQRLILPMCKNLVNYEMIRLPNSFGHTTQIEIYRIIEHYWRFMDGGCSKNLRLFLCSLYAPKYDEDTDSVIRPCKQTCMRAKKKCSQSMLTLGSRWLRRWRCKNLPTRNCIRPVREPRNVQEYSYCETNTIPVCQGLPYTVGTLPNLFLQRSLQEITTEMQYYEPLLQSRCFNHLNFFLCGTYMPFCVWDVSPILMPCRELCYEVIAACGDEFHSLYEEMPWPNKLQCHRFQPSNSSIPCAMPGDF